MSPATMEIVAICSRLLLFLAVTSVSVAAAPGVNTSPNVSLRQAVVAVVGEKFGHEINITVPRLMERLRTTFDALPRATEGSARVDAPTARYALYRHFLRERSWEINGIVPSGMSWNSTPPHEALHVTELQEYFMNRFQDGGMDLEELAVFAATFETLIFHGYTDRLLKVYAAHGISTNHAIPRAEAERLLSSFAVVMLQDMKADEIDKDHLSHQVKVLDRSFPAWPVVKECYADLAAWAMDGKKELRWPDMTYAVSSIVAGFSKCTNQWCSDLRTAMRAMEDPAMPGRLPLPRFYQDIVGEIHGVLHQSPEYLKASGSLDFSDLAAPRIFIPNYVRSASQCPYFSAGLGVRYGTCCPDTCEEKLVRLEAAFRSPSASANAILREVQAMLPAAMPPLLLRKLRDIEEEHGGAVPIHGRLLAQWLHFVFPADCPYPHVVGSVTNKTSDEWAEESGIPDLEPAEVLEYLDEVEAAAKAHPEGAGSMCSGTAEECAMGMGMWSLVEELVSPDAAWGLASSSSSWSWFGDVLRAVAGGFFSPEPGPNSASGRWGWSSMLRARRSPVQTEEA